MAKVAYGFVVWQLGLEGIKSDYVLPAILGQKNDIGMWVGCDGDGDKISTAAEFFEISLNFIDTPKRDILVEIKLIGPLSTPNYLVVVGEPIKSILERFNVPH